MSRRNGRPKSKQHFPDRLIPSQPDDYCLARKVEENFLIVCATHQRIKGEEIYILPSMDADIVRWRQMRVRHESGDLRHTEAELRSVKAVAEWTVRVNAALRNQVVPKIDWED